MIYFCPHCGSQMKPPISDGIATCNCCNRLFDTSNYNNLLAAAWLVRKWRFYDLPKLQQKCDLNDQEIAIIDKFIVEEDMSHDEFIKYLDLS